MPSQVLMASQVIMATYCMVHDNGSANWFEEGNRSRFEEEDRSVFEEGDRSGMMVATYCMIMAAPMGLRKGT